jgi:DNA helicase-2/ATP-dependent DNA helicase PcrA
MNPTPEQSAILQFVTDRRDNLMIEALAGSGKTTMLEMIDAAVDGPHLLVCFNKAIAAEAQRRVRSTTQVRTFNSLGHRIWAEAIGKRISLVKTKKIEIFREMVEEVPKHLRKEMWKHWEAVSAAVDMARALGYIPNGHVRESKRLISFVDLEDHLDEVIPSKVETLVDDLLLRSIRMAYNGIIDYSDQTYMPALFGGAYPQFPLVLVDEWQDLSPINQAIVDKLCRRSRVIGVGDEAQAIYAFRGASEDSIPSAKLDFAMESLPLSISFRCPECIVDNVRWRVPHFRASRGGGSIQYLRDIPNDHSTVICRNNAPLFALAVKLLVAGHKVDVSGVDLAGRLASIMSKLGPEETPATTTIDLIDAWEADKLANDSKSAPDIAAAMRVFANQSRSLGGALATIRHVTAQQGDIHFLTGHKAKGLEWDHIYHLDQHLLREEGQDPNLRYVIDTRSKDRLTYIDSRELQS